MSNVARSYPTTSHVLVLAPTAAAEAFDVMIHDPSVAAILTPAGPISFYPMNGYRPLRELSAGLRLPGRYNRTLDVTLELLPWSESRSELVIWSNSRPGIFPSRSVSTYLHAAHEALAALAALLAADPVVAAAPRHGSFLPAARDRKTSVAAGD